MSAADIEALREEFEAWLPPSMSRETTICDGDIMYCDDWVQGAWVGYCAAISKATGSAA